MKTKFFIAALAGLFAIGTVYATVNSETKATSACSCSDCSNCCGSSCACE